MAHANTVAGQIGTDAQSTNESDKSSRQFSDLDLFFAKNSVGFDVNKVTDIQAVKRSVRNLVLLNQYEKPFQPQIYAGVREMLFENMTQVTAIVIARKIEDVINNFEPRVRLNNVKCYPNYDNNAYDVTVGFYVVNAPTELVELDVMLERLR
tara:strand:- start:1954 stop:2409 length:456 start_codon:yes stop_codon:yes gene_type:complete